MKNIGIVTSPYLGHVYPTLSLGKQLLEFGYRVFWLCDIQFIETMLPENGILLYTGSGGPDVPEPVAQNPHGLQSLKDLYEKALVPFNRSMYLHIDAYHKKIGFDFIITDQQAFAGALYAKQHGIPFATSVTAPAAIDPSVSFPETHNFERDQIKAFQESKGVISDQPLVCSSPLTFVYNTKEFLKNTNFPSTYHFVGPSISGRKEWDIDISKVEEARSKGPVVLISLGSVLKREEKFINLVINAFEQEPLTVVLVSDPVLRSDWPDNFLIYSYIPQLKMLDLVDAVICHAGHNTVCEALSRGLPLVTLPVAFDQSYVATKVTESGVGIRLKYKRLSSAGLKEALYKILNDASYRSRAVEIQTSFALAGGETRAAQLIISMLGAQSINTEICLEESL